MKVYFWNTKTTKEEINSLLEVIKEQNYPLQADCGDVELTFSQCQDYALKVTKSESGFHIDYNSINTLARGVATALAGVECAEKTTFKAVGIMLDCSRDKVFTVEYLKGYFTKLAMMGQNVVMLYCEDTYAMPDEPFFGYMRGGYTMAELKELDSYSKKLGIELVGCIQTLGHLTTLLQWNFAYRDVTDSKNVLLVDEPKTYQLIEKMIKFWSEALTSRRIHIGMDETHDLGRGRFMDRHGYENAFELFNRHLAKVNDICKDYGFANPIIWSDMYFRLSNTTQDYYDDSNPIPEDVKAKIPKNVTLCYWDYYHDDQEFYSRYIKNHRDLGFEPIMGSGIWTWWLFWSSYQKSLRTAMPCIKACKESKVNEIIFTMWGDNGGFCQYDSALANLLWASDLIYGVDIEKFEDFTAKRYRVICDDDYYLFKKVSTIHNEMKIKEISENFMSMANELWDDPIFAISYRGYNKLDATFGTQRIATFSEVANLISNNQEAQTKIQYKTIQSLCEFLMAKYTFRKELEELYKSKNIDGLKNILGDIDIIIEKINIFAENFRSSWYACAKPFGIEVIQKRNATQVVRYEELKRRLEDFVNGKISTVEELDASFAEMPYGYSQLSLFMSGSVF